MSLIFKEVRGGGDNLAYVIGCSSTKTAAVVDPIAAHDILEFCEEKKLKIKYVLNTHGHPDHTGGNDVIVKSSGARVMAHKADRVANVDAELEDEDVIEVGKVKVGVIHTPGHTPGSVCFRLNNKLLSGDTVFLSGAGNTRFGGSVEDLFKSFAEKILPLPAKVALHPGHDYAEANLRFARTVEPDNVAIDHKLKALKDAIKKDETLISTIGQEKNYNPFFRFGNPELIESLKAEYPDISSDDPLAVFRLIRELRNNW